jgi:type II secretory pathway component PulK
VRIPSHPQPRGIALIIVMLVVVTLSLLAGAFAYSMKVETTLARNASTDAEMEWMGRSGVELAKYIISQGGPGAMQFDALNQKWAGGTGDTNSPVADIPMENYPIGRGTVSVKIVDNDRKFNINTAPRNQELVRQATILVGVDAAEGNKIVNAILDWIDPDDNPQMGSGDTESSYYMTLAPPYKAKNGLIDDLSELMLINGITPAMFYGSGQSGAFSRGLVRHPGSSRNMTEEPAYPVGFADLFTTLSSGMINLNTASATVLQLVPDVDEHLAQAIITARSGPDGVEGNEDDMPFRGIQDLARVPGMPPPLMGQFARYFSTRSSTFEVHVEAQIGNYKRHFVSTIRREGNRPVSLFFYWN